MNDWLESEAETEEQPEVFQSVRSSVMYAAMQMVQNDTGVPTTETKTHIKESEPVNVFFFLDNRNAVGEKNFALAKESIISASDIILKKSSDAHIYVILCTNAKSDAAYKLIDGNCADDSFTDISSLEGELDSITLRSTNTLSDNCVLSDALNYALDNYDKDRATYCFYLFNQKNVLFRESTGRSYLSEAETAGFNVSIISEIDKAYIDGYAIDLYKETNGVHIKKFSNFSNDILKHMYNSVPVIDDDTETYNMLLASGLQKVTLDAPITEDYKEAALDMWNNPNSTKHSDYADTDGDGLYDFQEIDFISDRIKFVDGKVKLPSFQDCLDEKDDLFYVEDGLSRYIAQIEKDDSMINMTDLKHKIYDKTYLLPILSDPTDETGDTDGDGFVDYYEYKCHENRNTENSDTSINYLNGLRKDEWQAKSDLGRLVRIAGFNYDQQQKILRSDQYPIQRFFGFNRSIDVAADTVLSSSIYCDPICFFYDGKEYMLELWKGQYGIMSGAEVGLYYRTPTAYTRTITVADFIELVETIVNGLVDYEDLEIDVNEVIYQLARELSDDNILIEICDFLGVDLPELINNIIDMSYDLEDICDYLGIEFFDTVIYEHTYLDDYGCNYDPDNYYDEKWYRSVAPQDMIEVHYEFGTQKKNNDTDTTEFKRDDYHWWTTGFEWGKYTKSEDEIVLGITIDFKSEAMRDAFYDGGDIPEEILSLGENKSEYLYENQKAGAIYFKENNKTNSNFDCEKIGTTKVYIRYQDYCFKAQPQSDGDKAIIQLNNRALLDVYETAKEAARIAYEYDSTNKLDRLLYTNDPNLLTVDDFIYGFDATDFFAFNSPHTEFLKHAIAENAFSVDGDYTWTLYNSLVTNLANNAASFSYSKEYWSSLLNVGSSVLDVVDSLGIQLTVGDVLGILLLTGNNTNDLRLIAEQIADTKYTDGYSTKYLYEYYEEWYMEYAQMYDIMATRDNYDWNHFPGLIFSTEFVVNRVKNLRAS